MKNLIVVDDPARWPLRIPDVPLVAARRYLTDPVYAQERGLRIFNMCRSLRYQGLGYYVSLLALARDHKPIPSIPTMQDMRSLAIARTIAGDIEDEVQRALRNLKSRSFTLSVYFGRNLARRYESLSARLFRLFPAPLLRAEFERSKNVWKLQSIRAIGAEDIPASHRDFVIRTARAFFAGRRLPSPRRSFGAYALAILANPREELPPSNPAALQRFAEAGRREGFDVDFIDRSDFSRIAEFDALFIRETTSVDHHTFRFSRRANAEGLVVIDDPESIVRCTNKVYLAELLARGRIPTPRTRIVHRDNREVVAREMGYPCVLKAPDSSYSRGVFKVGHALAFLSTIQVMFEHSDLIIAQEFVPSSFDWRVGILDRRPLFACRYHMVENHWQIYKAGPTRMRDGEADAVAVDAAPARVIHTAVRASKLVGDGFYGVDLKQFGSKVIVMEINDNPSVDAGVEDGVLGKALYESIMRVFRQRLEKKRGAPRSPSP